MKEKAKFEIFNESEIAIIPTILINVGWRNFYEIGFKIWRYYFRIRINKHKIKKSNDKILTQEDIDNLLYGPDE